MPTLSSYDYTIIRVVPQVEREEFVNVGVIVFCPTQPFLGARIALDRQRLAALAPGLDMADVERQLALIPLICDGDPRGGPIAEMPVAQRFHWLAAPRSTVIQTSLVHSGLTDDPEAALVHLLDTVVRTSSTARPRRPSTSG